MTKQNRVNQINEMIERSNVAKNKNARVELVDNKIVYKMTIGSTRKYDARVSLREIAMTLNGEDMRALLIK